MMSQFMGGANSHFNPSETQSPKLLKGRIFSNREISSVHKKPRTPHTQFEGSQYHTKFPNKYCLNIKRELPKYDGKGHKGAIVWVNKMDVVFEANPPIGEQEKVMTTFNNLEAEAYDWFLWCRTNVQLTHSIGKFLKTPY